MSEHRINHQPVFLLASAAWRENSLRVEAFSRDYGRLSLLARSARTRGSELRGVLMPFVPVSASWYGKEELKTLHRAEWLGGWPQPRGRALFSALYANELVAKLTAREDPAPDIFHALHTVLHAVCTTPNHAAALRHFEFKLLNALGLCPDFARDGHGKPVQPEQHYRLHPEAALAPAPPHRHDTAAGSVFLALASGSLNDALLPDAARVMRLLMDFRLPEIHARTVLQQLKSLKNRQNG